MVEPGVPPNAGLFISPESPYIQVFYPNAENPVAKAIRAKESRRKSFKDDILPLSKQNFVFIGIGLAVILGGYAAMLEGSVEGFLPLVVAPILLVLGYCVLIPFGIMYRKIRNGSAAVPATELPRQS